MATKVGVGESNKINSFEAGVEAAANAFKKANTKKCDFVLLFSTVGYNLEELLKGVRSVTGTALLSGCSGEGIITQSGPKGEVVFTNTGPKESNNVAAVMIFKSDELKFKNCLTEGIRENSEIVGEIIGKKIGAETTKDSLALLTFVDYKTNLKSFFNGLEKTLKELMPLCGALAGDNFILGQTFQFYNDKVVTNAASCVLISGKANIEIGISHGCVPLGMEKTITKAEGNIVYEIDNKKAWDFFRQYLDESIQVFTKEIRTYLGFGVVLPENMATEYNKYIIRAPLGQNPDGSMNFSTEIPEGTTVQMMRRDAEKISLGVQSMAERINKKLGKKKPKAVIHIDCAARGRMFFGDEVKEKEVDPLQNVFGKDIPWLGLFACGEIATIKQKNYIHNQTVVLFVIY